MKLIKKIPAFSVGSCIHVAGIMNFLNAAKKSGFETLFLGSAVSLSKLAAEIAKRAPDIVGISYRLSPESVIKLFEEFDKKIARKFREIIFILGTTKSVADALANSNLLKIFDYCIYRGL